MKISDFKNDANSDNQKKELCAKIAATANMVEAKQKRVIELLKEPMLQKLAELHSMFEQLFPAVEFDIERENNREGCHNKTTAILKSNTDFTVCLFSHMFNGNPDMHYFKFTITIHKNRKSTEYEIIMHAFDNQDCVYYSYQYGSGSKPYYHIIKDSYTDNLFSQSDKSLQEMYDVITGAESTLDSISDEIQSGEPVVIKGYTYKTKDYGFNGYTYNPPTKMYSTFAELFESF